MKDNSSRDTVSRRLSYRDDKQPHPWPEEPKNSATKGEDSIAPALFAPLTPDTTVIVTTSRVSRTMLTTLEEKISEQDLSILRAIQHHRFLTTRQVTGFCFSNKATPTAALRAANRALKKLQTLRLITPMSRRIGGVRAGSGGFVWSTTEPGHRFLHHVGGEFNATTRRTRFRDPSPTFLEHTLAVADVHLLLERTASDPSHESRVRLIQLELEPDCWRTYLSAGGTTLTLKPDLHAITRIEEFEDHWFFEIDRATEPPSRIIRKCQQYQEYYHTGQEQDRHGLIPAVIWIVPTYARQTQLEQRLASDPAIEPHLFTVLTVNQLPQLLRSGPPTTQTTI